MHDMKKAGRACLGQLNEGRVSVPSSKAQLRAGWLAGGGEASVVQQCLARDAARRAIGESWRDESARFLSLLCDHAASGRYRMACEEARR